MSSASTEQLIVPPAAEVEPRRRSRRRKTSHLKMVPPTRELREAIRARTMIVAASFDVTHPPNKDEMEIVVRALLEEMDQPEAYVGWTMVVLAGSFWRDQVAAVPPERRLFLLPHCLKHAEGCPADYDEFGLDCRRCGACEIADFRSRAEDLGYRVLVAEGSPIVLKIIISGYVDAVVGVACLNVLERAIDKILIAGIPCMAVPLLSSDCRNTSVDEEWVREMIDIPHQAPKSKTRSYVHLMRAAAELFEPNELERLSPRLRGGPRLAETNGQGLAGLDAIAATEAIAYDFLSKGGKHSRPFVTLAAYDAMTGGKATGADGAMQCQEMSDAARRVAMSIETFHKASLVHDDIEDDDAYRYGEETIHRAHGLPTAINVGDYLIGLGYRLVSRETEALGAETAANLLDHLATAHMRLCEGQGAELIWRDALDKKLKPIDALKIYALKTSPAFEVALYSGLRLAGKVEGHAEMVSQFSKNLGIAFQIINDFSDWYEDDGNKRAAAGDLVGKRPTIFWALAHEKLSAADQQKLEALAPQVESSPEALAAVRALYESAGVFDTAQRLIDKYQQRAEAIADEVEPDELRRLLYYLVDTVLDRGAVEAAEPAVVEISLAAPEATS